MPAFAQDVAPPPDAAPARTGVPLAWTFRWGEHPTLRFGERLQLDFRARLQGDLRSADAALGDSDTSGLDLARRRVGVAGTVGRVAEFQVERELVDGEGWRDVYVNYRQVRRLQVQAGKFKIPFGLDENTSSGNLDFVYRSRAATQLAPGRDRGVMAHGRAGILRYEWGAFAHDGDNARGIGTAPGAGVGTAGRLVVQPFRNARSVFEDLQVGGAYTARTVSAGIVELRADTALGQSFFRSEFAVQGARRRVGTEIRWRPGPFSVQSEVSRLTTERLGQSIADTDLPQLVGSAWYVQGTWTATGEAKRRGNAPARPLLGGGIGSIELAARIEAVRFYSGAGGPSSTGPRADTILPRSDRVVTLGVNWRPHRWVRVQANLIHDTLSESSENAAPTSTAQWSRVLRFGVSL